MSEWIDPYDRLPDIVAEIWVRWEDRKSKDIHVSTSFYDQEHGFMFVKSANEPEEIENFTFDYIGQVTGWQPMVEPEKSA